MSKCFNALIAFVLVFICPLSAAGLPVRYGLELHLDADAITGLVDGGNLSSWPDMSVHNRNATQSTVSRRPLYKADVLNGKPVVRFDGIDDYLSFSEVANIRTVFWVIKEDADASSADRCLLGHSSAKYFHRGHPKEIWSSAYTEDEVLDGVTKLNGSVVDGRATDVPNDFAIISVVTTGNCKANQLTRDRGFEGRVWQGDIAEIIIYSRVLTKHEEVEVGAYLLEKYNIAAAYPSSEPESYPSCKPGDGGDLKGASSNPLVITMDVNETRQKIQGFGASDCWSVQYVGNWPEAKTKGMADLLFSSDRQTGTNKPIGIGLSQWRFNIGAGSKRQNNIYDQWRQADTFYNEAFTSYDWTRLSGQRNFMQLAKERGVEQFLAFPISPPINMTKNGYAFCDTSVGSTNLADDKYDEFAVFMADFLKHFRDVEGVDFSYISPLNELQWAWDENADHPGYSWQEGCRFDSADVKKLVDEMSRVFAGKGVDSEILICESGELPDLTKMRWWDLNYAYDFFDPASSSFFGNNNNVRGTITTHSYWSDGPGTVTSTRQSVKTALDRYQLPYAQTEYCILGDYGPGRDLGIDPALWIARTVHSDLVVGGVESWQWWLGISPHDYKDGLVYCDKNKIDGNYYESKMLWAMGNFSRFVRPGMYRVELSRSDNKTHEQVEEDLMVSGYYSSRHNRPVLVFVNYSASSKPVRIQFDNLSAGTRVDYMIPYVTAGYDQSKDSLTPYEALLPDDTFDIPGRSVVTMVGMSTSAGPGDINLDGVVDGLDLEEMAEHWLDPDCSDCGRTDITGNGEVDYFDFTVLADSWLNGVVFPVVLLPMDEGQGLSTLEHISNTDCEMVNMDESSWYNGDGHVGLVFGGVDDYVDIPDNDFSGQWTVSFLSKGLVSSPFGSIVLGNRNDNNNYLYMWNGTKVQFKNSSGQSVEWNDDTDFYNKWRHVVLVGNDSEVELYLDGNWQGSRTIEATFKLYTVGAGHTAGSYNYNGVIDDVHVYDTALTRDQIESLY